MGQSGTASTVYVSGDPTLVSQAIGGWDSACWGPLVLDLEDDGLKTTSVFDPVIFDLDGDGLSDVTAWLAPEADDAFLALDLNENSMIDDGTELLGDASGGSAFGSRNGFEALASYDSDLDGRITPQDPVWTELLVWQDSNYNGTSEESELRPLTSLGIVFIQLEINESDEIDGHGNRYRYRSWFVRKGKGRSSIIDVYFDYDPGR